MARTAMATLITHTARLCGQEGEASPPFSDDQIEAALDARRLELEWVLLDNDPDFHYYRTRARAELPTVERPFREAISVPDFASYTRVGFFEDGYQLRDDRTFASNVHTPDSHNIYSGTFIFSSAPNVELYFFGNAYNVYQAAADLLAETPDFGRVALKSQSILSRSEQFDTEGKIKQYRRIGYRLNHRYTKIYRG